MSTIPNRGETLTGEGLGAFVTQKRSQLLRVVEQMCYKKGGKGDKSNDAILCDDVVQETCRRLERCIGKTIEVSLFAFAVKIARRVLNTEFLKLKRIRRELQLIDDTMEDENGEEFRWEVMDEQVATPSFIMSEQNRLQRKRTKLVEIMDVYNLRAQEEPEMRLDREILERRLRGQNARAISQALSQNLPQMALHPGMKELAVLKNFTVANVNTRLSRLRKKELKELLHFHDQRKSVFLTFFRKAEYDLKPSQPVANSEEKQPRFLIQTREPQVPIEENDPLTFCLNSEQVFEYLLYRAGVMCILDDRLEEAAAIPDHEWPSDIRYHVLEVACPYCTAVVNALQEDVLRDEE